MDKVTSFVLRRNRTELLLFEHEDRTIQLPAGTVEEGEPPMEAGLREVSEETGLEARQLLKATMIDRAENELARDEVVVERRCPVYSRPRLGSMNWGSIPRGITVKSLREADGFMQVRYDDWHDEIARDYLTYCLIGWVGQESVSRTKIRHYCVIDAEDGRDTWTIDNDNHLFRPFWARMDALPHTIAPWNRWIGVLHAYLESLRGEPAFNRPA